MANKAIGATDAAIASRFKTFRITYIDLSQDALANEIGVNKKTISFIENSRTAPNQDIITALSTKYKLNSEWLMKGTGEPVNRARPNADSIANIQAKINLMESQMIEFDKKLNAILKIVQKS